MVCLDAELALSQNTSNVHMYLEQFFLRDNCEPIEQPLHNKQDSVTTWRRSGNHESCLGAEGKTQDGKKAVSAIVYLSPEPG